MSRGVSWVAMAVFLGSTGPAMAQPPGNPLVPAWVGPVTKLEIHPAAGPDPSMKYRLLPELRELQPGNAAYHYQRAHSPEWWTSLSRMPQFQKMSDYLDVPLRKMPRKDAEALTSFGGLLKEIDRAARCEGNNWNWNDRLREDGLALLLPEVNSFRQYAILLALRARLEMLDGKYDQAMYSMQTALALGRHVGDAPLLINAMVGMACVNLTLEQVKEFIQQPGAPNLYWALADLPRPLVDLRKPIQGERMMVDAMFPGVRKALENPKLPPLTTEQLLARFENLNLYILEQAVGRAQIALVAARAYPQGKQYLLDQGWTAAQVDALPVLQVAVMINIVEFDRLFDAMYRWHGFSFPQARRGLRDWDQALRKAKVERREAALLPGYLLPALHRIVDSQARVQRKAAALQTVEALRLYAAAHEGKLPQALADIKEVPIPLDPWTGQAFSYHAEGNRAALYGPPLPGDPADLNNTLNFAITLKSSEKE